MVVTYYDQERTVMSNTDTMHCLGVGSASSVAPGDALLAEIIKATDMRIDLVAYLDAQAL
jgi:hypothetical protein